MDSSSSKALFQNKLAVQSSRWLPRCLSLVFSAYNSCHLHREPPPGSDGQPAILQAAKVTYGSFLLVCVSHHGPLSRLKLFSVGLLLTSVAAMTPFSIISVASDNGDIMLKACASWAAAEEKSWQTATITPFDTVGRIWGAVQFAMAIPLLGCWQHLRGHDKPRQAARQFKVRKSDRWQAQFMLTFVRAD